jgi:hypothetical protein
LRALSSRLNLIVGKPTKGIQFDLIRIVDKLEGCILDLKDLLATKLRPGLIKAHKNLETTLAESTAVRAGLGGNVLQKLRNLESSIQAWEVIAKANVTELHVAQLGKILLKEMFPALKDIWDLYRLSWHVDQDKLSGLGPTYRLKSSCSSVFSAKKNSELLVVHLRPQGLGWKIA